MAKVYKKVYNNIIETIGRTPLVRLNKINEGLKPTILAKIEAFNPGGSVKDRIGMSMVEAAEEAGIIKKGDHIIEPTSGNTGIALALVAAAKGYKLTLTMPSSMSLERRKILKAFGANLVLTDPAKGMKGAVEKAEELAKPEGNVFIPQQFKNKANPEIHRTTTAQEIIDDTGGNIDAFVAGIGTGGTITGVGEVLKEKIGQHIKIFAVEPIDSPVLSGGKPGGHKIQGIGAGFIPEVLNTAIYDRVITVSYDNAAKTARKLALLEGIFSGISSGAAAWAALEVAKEFQEEHTIVVVLPDTGERYLTTELYNI
ncbi:MAG: cysteine synthase A [Candidatus Helarchaeota archaeon]|nr:cysteine synthase A [Candidatus Helarchaeota archaeon]